MRKIRNPHLSGDPQLYRCIGCSPHNPVGLNLEFWDDGESIISMWQPRSEFMGWVNVLHGGIQATLLDEIAAWVVYTKCATAGVTAELQVKYLKPLHTNQGEIRIEGKLVEQNKRLAIIHAKLLNDEDELCAEADVKYFIYPEVVARKKFHYPGVEAFYE
ncbi:PaaI family thioesterase [Sunxiuqinia sp. sy24]|uniref:PaaI family thioesterase n=1 Tax=Sunxiuqinia sp. sy24 TaxID=3461495 RepID=UPI004045CA38